MKQAIYIFSLYIGAVAFFTLSYFRQPLEISLLASFIVVLATGAVIYAVDRSEHKNDLITRPF